jgi:glycosyltransferase involved in cell wall biosynthesis
MKVAICIATFRRPKLLRQLLEGLGGLTFIHLPEPDVRVIIVDNDSDGSAETIARTTLKRWPVTYSIETKRGIAQVRNCALRQRADADFVAFIDDDECPDSRWLEELLSAVNRFDAEVVWGPVVPNFAEDVPRWIQRSDFFDPVDLASGSVLEWCATNNTLVSSEVLEHITTFDEGFQLSGADDYHFFRRVFRSGFKIVWSREALVSETIARDRANVPWLVRRAYRGGNCAALVEVSLDGRMSTRLKRCFKAFVRIAQGICETFLVPFRGKAQLTQSLRRMSLGAGMLTGLAGVKYQAYKSITGK